LHLEGSSGQKMDLVQKLLDMFVNSHRPLFVLVFVLIFGYCAGATQADSPEDALFSEREIRFLLGDSQVLSKLIQAAEGKKLTLEDWKEQTKKSVSDSDIQAALLKEGKKPLHVETIERVRNEMRTRIVWSRMLSSIGEKSSPLLGAVFIPKSEGPRFLSSDPDWVVIEWSDFNCPYCKKSSSANQKIIEKYKGKISWYFQSFPLDVDSKDGLRPLSISNCIWAKARSEYSKSVELLYQLGSISVPGCQTDEELSPFSEKVLKEYKTAKSLSVKNIPSFQVNGVWIVGAMDEKSWERALKATTKR